MRVSTGRLADGREIIYYDDRPNPPPRTAMDPRDLPARPTASEIRRDPLTGEPVILAAHRQARTHLPPADRCPLCPSGPGRPTEVPEPGYDVVVFENRFSALAGATPGRCEVVCFTDAHDRSFRDLGHRRIRTILDVWADRTRVLGELPGVAQVFPFENRGDEIGVTLHHPHGQIFGYPFIPPRAERMLAVARDHLAAHGRPAMADVLAAERDAGIRILATGTHWTAFVPAAARWPVEVRVVPHRQVPDLPALTVAERDEFARLYPRVLHMLDALYERPLPYVAAWHQAPVRADRDLAWLHLEVFSVRRGRDKLKYLAASESAMAAWINDVRPEELAERLRANDPVPLGDTVRGDTTNPHC